MIRSYSVIIVTWNALKHLQTFLPSVMVSASPETEIIIADNASTDDTAKWVAETYPSCKVVTLDKNYGYCGGNNRAAAHATGDILIFLNNDVRVEKDWIREMHSYFDDPNTVAVQPKIRSHTNPEYFEYAGATGGFLDKLAYPFCRGRIFDTVEKDEGQYDQSTNIFWASGAAMAIRKEVFQEMGGFDEDFEFHMEEIDLCWRCLNLGYTITYAPESVVYHLGGGSLPMNSPRKVYYNFRNNLIMLWKNDASGKTFRKLFIRLCLDGVAGVRSLLSFKPLETFAIIRAHFAFYRRWMATHKKRKALQSSRKIDQNPEVMSNLSVISEYFLKGKKTYRDLF